MKAVDAVAAVERMSELRFADWDYPRFIDGVCVAEVGSDSVQRFDVEVETVPYFKAREIRVRHASVGQEGAKRREGMEPESESATSLPRGTREPRR